MAAGAGVTETPSRAVVVTGASRGLGLATAAHLRRAGWTVVAAVRSPEVALARLGGGDDRLVAVRLDLDDPASIDHAAAAVLDTVGAPHGIVHNAGIAGVGALEELPMDTWQQIFSTNFFGPVRLTRALLPAIRAAGRGRIVMVSSVGATRGMPGIGAYSSAKGALERWAESLSFEVAPFGLGVTVLVAGAFKTDILELTPTYADRDGPYAPLHEGLETSGRRFLRFAGRPDRFAPAVERALDERRPFSRHGVGLDARLVLAASKVVPSGLMQRMLTRAVGIPRPRTLRDSPLRHTPVTTHREEEEARG
jgi:NAD(P)-dependent dehydrogenase (short-subunit alcohol dehydrogenase family)